MAIYLVKRDPAEGATEIDGINATVVEAATAGDARTAANALDARFTVNTDYPYFQATSTADDLEGAAYLGGTLKIITDLGF